MFGKVRYVRTYVLLSVLRTNHNTNLTFMYTFKLLEYLFLSKMTKEINGRLYIDEEMWKVINECTVDLIVETERERER